MKKLALIFVIAFFAFACSNQNKKQSSTNEVEKEKVVLTVDDLYKNASDLVDKEVVIKGTVMHVCQEGGQRCFLMGSNEDINIRVEAGEKIGAFSQELMGSEVEIVGVLTEVKSEAEAHNPGKEHGEENSEKTEETKSAHEIIAQAQEEAERVYFIQGIHASKIEAEKL